MHSKVKGVIAVAIVLVLASASLLIFISGEPLKVAPDSGFLKSDAIYRSTPGYGPYLYEEFNSSKYVPNTNLILTQYLFAGYGNNHSDTHDTNFTFNSSNPHGPIELGESFNLILISNSTRQIGIKVISVELVNRSISYNAQVLDYSRVGTASSQNISFTWVFPDRYSVNPSFQYTMVINIQLYRYFGPFYMSAGTMTINATQFPINIIYKN